MVKNALQLVVIMCAGITFTDFLQIVAISRANWEPNEHSWLCSKHFVSGEKSNNPLAPNYIPTLLYFYGFVAH